MLKKKDLKAALHRVFLQDDYFDELLQFEETEGRTEEEIADWAVEQCCTDSLLAYLNDHMGYIPICAMSLFCYHTDELVREYDAGNGIRYVSRSTGDGSGSWHGSTAMPKLMDEEAVFLGYRVLENGANNQITTMRSIGSYITESGRLVSIEEQEVSICVDVPEEDRPRLIYRSFYDRSRISLNDICHLFPSPFAEAFDW